MIENLLLVSKAYLILLGLQLLVSPWLFKRFKDLEDGGWVLGRTLGTLAVTVIIWTLAYLRIPVNTAGGVWISLGLISMVSLKDFELKGYLEKIKTAKWMILTIEALFLMGFFGFSLIRSFQSQIMGLEKFMDFGFIKSYSVSPTLPASDMWWATEQINYYSFGHFWTSIMAKIWQLPVGVSYNLMLAFILASAAILAFAIVIYLLLEEEIPFKKGVFAGILAAILLIFSGNSHTISKFLENGNLNNYWYADATRFIHNTIHEFPAYSFVVSDLHGHVLSLPMVLTFLIMVFMLLKNIGGRWTTIISGILLGMLTMTNTWDTLIYGMVLGLVLLIKVRTQKLQIAVFFKLIMGLLISFLLTTFFWIINFKSIAQGIGLVTERTPINQLVTLWMIHIYLTGIGLITAVSRKRNWLVLVLGSVALLLIIIPEVVYIKDIYLNHPRANTMFKLTYQAFVIMSLVLAWLVGRIQKVRSKLTRALATLAILGLESCLLIFPFVSYNNFYNRFKVMGKLDGVEELRLKQTTPLLLADYLDKNRDGKNMVEAVGDSYSDFNLISAFSGVPTVLGWRVHEWLWRGSFDPIAKREEEVKRFYEGKNLDEAKEFLKKYNVGWIIVGTKEIEKYQVNYSRLNTLAETVLELDKQKILRVINKN